MDRLTKRVSNGMACLVKVKDNEQDVESPYPNTLKAILESIQRLAEHEDQEELAEITDNDGCLSCLYEDKGINEYPCVKCKRCYADKRTAKMSRDEE